MGSGKSIITAPQPLDKQFGHGDGSGNAGGPGRAASLRFGQFAANWTFRAAVRLRTVAREPA